jgi:Tol biopolymer transport system component
VKKATVVVVFLVVLCLTAGVATYMALRQTSSSPNLVSSMDQLPGIGHASNPSWSPDGLTILYASSGIQTIDLDGGNRRLTSEGHHPTWSPAGSSIAFVTDDGLEVMSRDGSERKILVNMAELVTPDSEHTYVDSTTWSPDGSMIAFVVEFDLGKPDGYIVNAEQFAHIWIVNADGSALRQLSSDPNPARDRDPVWSPDSQRVAFASSKGSASWDIWVINVDGSELRQLTTSAGTDWQPSWSPDGSKIAFSSGEDDPDIWVMDADGGNKTQLTTGSASYGHPAWSPDGSLIAFDSVTLGPVGNIWIMNADVTAITKLTKSATPRFTCEPVWIKYEEPRWSPDGTTLLFTNGVRRGNSSWGYDRLWVLELEQEHGELG